MSDIIFFNESHAKEKKESSKIKFLKIILAVFVSLLIIEVGIYFVILPCMENVKFNISGLNEVSEEEIIASCGNELFKNIFKFNSEKIASKISSISAVDSVSIRKVFPDKVIIDVKERQGVALTFINTGDRSIPIQIDKKGVLFPCRNLKIPEDGSVPIISGIPVENIPQGMRLPSKYNVLIESIANLQQKNKKYFAAISEIHVVPKESGNFELVLFPVQAKLKVLANRILNEETLQKMLVTLDVLKGLDPGVDVIDLRYGSISYHTVSDSTKVD